jgi:hypothetical protein
MVSDAPAVDAGIRAAYAALEQAGIELSVMGISVEETRAPGAGPETAPPAGSDPGAE